MATKDMRVLPSTRQNISSSPLHEEETDVEGASGENMLSSEWEKTNSVTNSIHPGFLGTFPVFMGF